MFPPEMLQSYQVFMKRRDNILVPVIIVIIILLANISNLT